jgi:nucleotide-binding universal stress UspA family protein
MSERPVVVVGVDGSEGSAEALRWAVAEAETRNWSVEAVAAWELLSQRHVDPAAPFDPSYSEADALDVLRHDVAAALGDRAGRVGCRAVFGLAAPALLEASDHAALLVVGARGLGGFRGLLLGSVSQHCVHHASVPVAVVRQVPTAAEPGRVVVGFDGSSSSSAALRWAAAHVSGTGAELQVLHAWHPPYVGAEPWLLAPFDADEIRRTAEKLLEEAIGSLDVHPLDPPPVPVVVEGGAARVLVEAAAGASLVVVGARGLGGFAGLLLGSVSDQVVRHAPCPVVVLPAGAGSS